MNRNIIVILLMLFSIIFINAQQTSDNVISANSQITEVRLNGFEDASFWNVGMSQDQGYITKQTRRGVPKDVSNDTSAIAKRDEKYGIPRTYAREKVLGVRVEYIARGYNWFSITPVKPIVIEGVCQSISVWVAGRNYKHWLKMRIQDFFGNDRLLYVDRLNFIGWKEMSVSIPDTVVQRDYHFVDKQGIKFNGFIVECDPDETFGVYYLYFDELRAMTDIFNEKTRDVDDMRDDW